jgi:hypothetical protein
MKPDDVKGLALYYQMNIMMTCHIGIKPKRENKPTTPHLLFMCEEIPKLIDNGKIEKAMRWLGFIQGVLCEKDFYTIDQLKDHNRTNDELH